ncbi:Holliday junction branch migration DNA helicase RuvB [Bifidobacterium sp. ESL0763]|uniref:Holliday junction branch migration DNA helicase RuvB n=1 Tax=Bifidobacterium sp. ESL0763 TaxID=2983227 RepID=UPI0023F667F7|nr:Holliday junction branch migration DNA helicase RuvB [Bifidobacterium sp. ESL0763]MDF7663826.1 Holliday junction branch migration DNA helicase RuvB [Bifidobacterium sp. ESL0763]
MARETPDIQENESANEESLRMVSSAPIGNEPVSDEELRPQTLSNFIGQPRLKAQLQLFLDAAKKRAVPPDHILLAGPPGLGKTTLAMIVANELEVPIRVTSGPAIQHAGDLASILSSLDSGEVLFIDEIHRLPRAAEELLYIAMEDFRVDVMVGKGPGATSIPLTLPRFTVIGATTREGMLPAPLRARFGFTAHLDFYPHEELERLIERSSVVLDIKLAQGSARQLSLRSRGTPRIANRLLRRVRDWAIVHDLGEVEPDDVEQALALYQVDSEGLDRLDLAVLDAIVRRFDGGPVGLNNLSAMIGEEAETVETVCEPYLVREGFLVRTPRGRVATEKAWKHLGIQPPDDVNKLF